MKKLSLLPLLICLLITYSFSNKSSKMTMPSLLLENSTELTADTMAIPSLLFKENSTEFAADTAMHEKDPGDVHALVRMMDENPTIVIELVGHADPGEKQAAELSLHRAETVVDKMIKNGVAKERLKAKGFGSTQPIFAAKDIAAARPKDQEIMHLRNRRVSFRIISFDYKEK
jgi:outer membrane protein OmpA-like peptidoglycan-associated protein